MRVHVDEVGLAGGKEERTEEDCHCYGESRHLCGLLIKGRGSTRRGHVKPRGLTMEGRRVLAQFKSEEGALVGPPFDLPVETDRDSLHILCNNLLENVSTINNLIKHNNY